MCVHRGGESYPPDWSSRLPAISHLRSSCTFLILATHILLSSHSFASLPLFTFLHQTFLDFSILFSPQAFPGIMELHRSCVLPSNAPALPEPTDSIPSRVLQERSANRRHEYAESFSTWKRSLSPSENVYSGRLGGCLTGNVGSQLNGEKSEAQIEYETKRLLSLLHRCEKYEKYRARQPQTAKDREQRWPDHLEEAFFRGTMMLYPIISKAQSHYRRLSSLAAHGSTETYVGWTASWSKRACCGLD